MKPSRHLLLAALVLAALPGSAIAAPPANDSPAAATPIAALPANIPGRTAEATMDLDEPAPLVTTEGNQRGLDRSVWFVYIAERDRSVLADTCDANFDNHVDVFVGPIGALTAVPTHSDDYSGCPGERRTFALTAGVPAFTRAIPLPGPGSQTASLAFSTIEFGEPSTGSDTGSVWFRLLPPRSEPYTVQIAQNPFEAVGRIDEARDGTINGLRLLATGYSGGAVSFNGLAGHRYYLRLSTTLTVASDVRFDLTTNSARGIGLLVTPARNTLGSVRRSGFRAVLSSARTCTLGVDLKVGARDARRLKLVKEDAELHGALRVGHVGGVLQTGRAGTVTVPIASKRVRQRLAHLRSVRFVVEVSVRGATGSRPVRRVVTVRR